MQGLFTEGYLVFHFRKLRIVFQAWHENGVVFEF
jgi:hypothetical protein